MAAPEAISARDLAVVKSESRAVPVGRYRPKALAMQGSGTPCGYFYRAGGASADGAAQTSARLPKN